MSVTVERAKDGSECKKVAVTCTLYEARSNEVKSITAAEVISFKRSLDDDNCLFSVLPGDSAEIDFVETSYGSVPKGSLLSYHFPSETLLQRKQQSVNQSFGTKKLKVCDAREQLRLLLRPLLCRSVGKKRVMIFLIHNIKHGWTCKLGSTTSTMTDIFQELPLKKHSYGTLEPTKRISFEECQRIEQATIGQHLYSLWRDYHTKTITSSNFKIIYRHKEVTDALVKWLINPPDLSH